MALLDSVLAGFIVGVADATPLEAKLRNAYHRELNRAVKEAAARFARTAITASAQQPDQQTPHAAAPAWQLPNPAEILPAAQTAAALVAATEPTRVKIVSRMMGDTLTSVGVGFDIQNPLAQSVLATMGSRITEISDLTRTEIMASLAESHKAGLSIPHAARAMASKVGATNVKRATLIARTEFIGAQNGSSLATVQLSGAATYKQWLATSDNRTREDHADASGQTVALADAFDVGGFAMMFPGDQNAPAGEVCNCRCTMTYTDQGPDGGSEPTADAKALQAFDKVIATHPVGSTRVHYTSANGQKVGPVKVISHDPLFGTKVQGLPGHKQAGQVFTLPDKAKLSVPKGVVVKEPSSTSPLIPHSHAVPMHAASDHPLLVQSKADFPIGTKVKDLEDGTEQTVTGYTPLGNLKLSNHATISSKTAAKQLAEHDTPPVHPAGEETKPVQAKPESPFKVGQSVKLGPAVFDIKSIDEDGTLHVLHGGEPGTIHPDQHAKLTIVEKPVAKAPPADLKTAVPYEVKHGDVVTFDSGYDPAHPYGTTGAAPVAGGKGVVTDVNWQTNQVMVNTNYGSIDKPTFVQTHLSQITGSNGEKALWKQGGGIPPEFKPKVAVPHVDYSHVPDIPLEFLPTPRSGKFLDPHEYQQALAHHTLTIDREGQTAVYEYTGSAHRSLNTALREGRTPTLAKEIDKAFAQTPKTTVAGKVWRATDLTDVPSAKNLRVGQVVVDEGFFSTSTVARTGFGRDVIEIEVPKGAHVIDLNASTGSQHTSETELLFARGQRMVITSIQAGNHGGRQITARLLVKGETGTATPPA